MVVWAYLRGKDRTRQESGEAAGRSGNLGYKVNRLKENIQAKHNEVIGHNEQLKDNAIKQTQADISTLTNLVFSLVNKIENLHALQSTSRNRLEEMQQNLESTHTAIAGTRKELAELVEIMAANGDKLLLAEEEYKSAELHYNEASAQYNEYNLQLTRQQSRINSLKAGAGI